MLCQFRALQPVASHPHSGGENHAFQGGPRDEEGGSGCGRSVYPFVERSQVEEKLSKHDERKTNHKSKNVLFKFYSICLSTFMHFHQNISK